MSEAERKKQLLYEIENNDKEIEYRDQMATRIVNDLQTIGDMMKDLDNLVKTQQPMLGTFLLFLKLFFVLLYYCFVFSILLCIPALLIFVY